MKIKTLLLIVVLMISLQATTVYGMGVGASPGNMSFKLAPGTSAEQPLYVINTGNETAKYDVFVNESAYKNWFTFSPSTFDLKAGEIKEVKVTLKVPASADTDIKCKINIPCTVPGRFVGAGVIIPVHVELSAVEESYSKGISSDSNSSKGTENSSNSLTEIKVKEILQQFLKKNIDVRLNFTQNITPIGENLKDSAEKGNSSNPLTQIKLRETLQRFLVKNIDSRFNFTQNITQIGEELKDYVEYLQVIGSKIIGNATRSFDGTIKSLNNTIKNLGEKNRDFLISSGIAKIYR